MQELLTKIVSTNVHIYVPTMNIQMFRQLLVISSRTHNKLMYKPADKNTEMELTNVYMLLWNDAVVYISFNPLKRLMWAILKETVFPVQAHSLKQLDLLEKQRSFIFTIQNKATCFDFVGHNHDLQRVSLTTVDNYTKTCSRTKYTGITIYKIRTLMAVDWMGRSADSVLVKCRKVR